MSVLAEIEEKALSLDPRERGLLAEKLLRSLPYPGEDDDDDGVVEAIRRGREMDANPDLAMTLEELDEMIRQRFPQCMSK